MHRFQKNQRNFLKFKFKFLTAVKKTQILNFSIFIRLNLILDQKREILSPF